MQDTTKTLGIIIGRFQPLHDGRVFNEVTFDEVRANAKI